jgi:hypothetical protein
MAKKKKKSKKNSRLLTELIIQHKNRKRRARLKAQ